MNVSARQLQAAGFVADVEQALASAGLEPQALVLEITEAAVVHDPESAARTFDALREMGVGLVLDDFGTGYSSLAMLDALPFDGLKLDRASVMRIGASGGAVPLVRAIVDLGRALGLSLVAEGIENEDQLAEAPAPWRPRGPGVPVRPPRACQGTSRISSVTGSVRPLSARALSPGRRRQAQETARPQSRDAGGAHVPACGTWLSRAPWARGPSRQPEVDSSAMAAPKRFPDRDEIAAVRAEAEPWSPAASSTRPGRSRAG